MAAWHDAVPGAGRMATRVTARDTELETMTLEELLPRWNKLFWWNAVRPVFRKMLDADLSLAESIVLRSLQNQGQLTVADAAEALCVTHSAASRAVDRLVRDGLIARQENPEDRRQKQLTLTPAGAVLIGEMEAVTVDRLRQIMMVLSAEEREQFRTLLVRLMVATSEIVEQGEEARGCG